MLAQDVDFKKLISLWKDLVTLGNHDTKTGVKIEKSAKIHIFALFLRFVANTCIISELNIKM